MAAFGAGVLASLVMAAVVAALAPSVGWAERTAVPQNGGLIALAATVGDQRQQVTVIEPSTHVVAIYHVDLASGELTLKAVRNIHWDLQMMEFNGTSPLPGEVRSILEQQQ
jgi:hypothetical protein